MGYFIVVQHAAIGNSRTCALVTNEVGQKWDGGQALCSCGWAWVDGDSILDCLCRAGRSKRCVHQVVASEKLGSTR